MPLLDHITIPDVGTPGPGYAEDINDALNKIGVAVKDIDPRWFGPCGPAASPLENLNALQDAADAAYDAGGGRIVLPEGELVVSSSDVIKVDSFVSFDGRGSTTLVQEDPDRTDNLGIIRQAHHTTTGSITAGSKTLTVASATGWVRGGAVQVIGAGPASVVEPGVKDPLYTRVRSISGTTITLEDAATTTVSNTTCRHGARGVRIRDIRFDGQRPSSINLSAVAGGLVKAEICADWLIEDCEFIRSPRTALDFDLGSVGCIVSKTRFHDFGAAEDGVSAGFGLKMFRGTRDSGAIACTFSGDSAIAVLIDDRTTTYTDSDHEVVNCFVLGSTFAINRFTGSGNGGIELSGTRDCRIIGNRFKEMRYGVRLVPTQGTTPMAVKANVVSDNIFRDCTNSVTIADLDDKKVFDNFIVNNVFVGTTPQKVRDLSGNTTNVIAGNYHEDAPDGAWIAESGMKVAMMPRASLPAASAAQDGRVIVEENVFYATEKVGTVASGVSVDFAADGIGAVAAGDLLVAVLSWVADNTNPTTASTPSGWTKQQEVLATAGAARVAIALYTKVAAGGETSVSFTAGPTNANCGMGVKVMRFPTASVHATPVNATSATARVSATPSTPFSCAGVTTTADRCQLFYFVTGDGIRDNEVSIREVYEFSAPASTHNITQCAGNKVQLVTGASGATSFTPNANSSMCGVCIAVRPSSGGTEGPHNVIFYAGGVRYRAVGTPF